VIETVYKAGNAVSYNAKVYRLFEYDLRYLVAVQWRICHWPHEFEQKVPSIA